MIIRSMPIEQLEREAEKDMELRIDRTEQDSANTPTIFNKYHKQYRFVQQELTVCESALKHLRFKKWLYYSGKDKPRVYDEKPLDLKVMKSDVNKFIDADEEVMEMTLKLNLLEIKKKFIAEKLKEISNRSYMINNILKTLEFKHGIS